MKALPSLAAAVALCALAGSASAQVITTTGNVARIDAPGSSVTADGQVDENALAGDATAFLWREQDFSLLGSNVTLDHMGAGPVTSGADLVGGTRYAGTFVESYYFLHDPLDPNGAPEEFSITFAKEIVGVMVTAASLEGSDSEFATTEFGTSGNRGFDLGNAVNAFPVSDDRHTLTLVSNGGFDTSQVRVLLNPEPSTLALLGLGGLGLGFVAERRRRRRKQKTARAS